MSEAPFWRRAKKAAHASAKLTKAEKLLYVYLIDRGDSDGDNIFPSPGTIAEETCDSVQQVRRHLRSLERKGWIRKIPLRWAGTGSQFQNALQPLIPPGEPNGPVEGEASLSKLDSRVEPIPVPDGSGPRSNGGVGV